MAAVTRRDRQVLDSEPHSLAESTQDGNSFIFCIIYVCFSTHVTSDETGRSVQSYNATRKQTAPLPGDSP